MTPTIIPRSRTILNPPGIDDQVFQIPSHPSVLETLVSGSTEVGTQRHGLKGLVPGMEPTHKLESSSGR